MKSLRFLALVAVLAVVVGPLDGVAAATSDTTSVTWPTYLGNIARTNYNGSETAINVQTAPNLKQAWSAQLSPLGTNAYFQAVSSQAIVANDLVYWSGWDGYERAVHASGPDAGKEVWSTYVGRTSAPACVEPPPAGAATTPAIGKIPVGGVTKSVLFLGAGGNVDASGNPKPYPATAVYAIDALTGAQIWHTVIGPSPDGFAWSSPAFYAGSVYIGLSSFGDCPLIQGKVYKLNAKTGQLTGVFKAVSDGCVGAGVWGSPTIDARAGTLYVAVGNANPCGTNNYGSSVVELRMSDMSVVGSWAMPHDPALPDDDFGSTPMLFGATIGGVGTKLVGAVNKNGNYYTFVRDHLNDGPIWSRRLSDGGDCPMCGAGDIAPTAWDGNLLYAGGTTGVVNGVNCGGSLRALNPADGSSVWEKCLTGAVIGGVTASPGILAVGTYGDAAFDSFLVVDSSNGNTLFTFPPAHHAKFWAAPTIANGYIYIGEGSGPNFYALSPG